MTRAPIALGGVGVIVAAAIGASQAASQVVTAGGPATKAASAVAVAPVKGSGAAGCQGQRLHITLAPALPGLSHHGYVLRFENRGGACTLRAYPGVDGLSPQGRVLVSARRTRSGYLGGLKAGHPIPLVHLATGSTASAIVEWVDGPIPGRFCPRVRSLNVTAPNTFNSVRFSPQALGSERLCDLEVHPVVAGMTGRES